MTKPVAVTRKWVMKQKFKHMEELAHNVKGKST